MQKQVAYSCDGGKQSLGWSRDWCLTYGDGQKGKWWEIWIETEWLGVDGRKLELVRRGYPALRPLDSDTRLAGP